MASKAKDQVIDFSGVKERGNFNPKRVPAGDYSAVITKVEDGESKKDPGAFQYIFTLKLEKFSQHSYPYYCKLSENQLWKLRNLAVAAGLNVPKKRMKFDPNKVVGKKVGVTMEDDDYEGKEKSVVGAVFPLAELAAGDIVDDDDSFEEGTDTPQLASDDDDAVEEEPKAKKKKKTKDPEPAEEPAAEEPKKKKKDKKKKKKGSEENLEDLDISDIG